jgi:MFS family permease
MGKVLADRNARWYLGGQLFSLFGDTSLWLAMGIWVKELTHSNGAAGLTFFFFTLASLGAPLAGHVVDRVRRRPLLIIANLAGAGVVLALLAVHGRGDVWLIWSVSLAYGVVYTFLSSGQSALLATMLPDHLLADANAVLSTTRESLRLVGPLAGAGLFALVGGGVVALVDAGTFLVATTSLLFVRFPEERPSASEHRWWKEMSAGAVHIWHETVLRQVVVATAVACLVVGFLETLAFAVVSAGLHRAPTFLGVLITMQGVGAVAGGLTASRAIRRLGEGVTVAIGLVIAAVGCALATSSQLAVVLAGFLLFGFALPWVVVAINTVAQRRTPNALQGRVASAVEVLVSTPQTVSIALGAVLVGLADYRLLLFVVAAVVALCGLWLATRPEQRQRGGTSTEAEKATIAGITELLPTAPPPTTPPALSQQYVESGAGSAASGESDA